MAKVRQPCQVCGGSGTVRRSADDPLAVNPLTKGILSTYAEKLCESCGGNRFKMVEVQIVEIAKG